MEAAKFGKKMTVHWQCHSRARECTFDSVARRDIDSRKIAYDQPSVCASAKLPTKHYWPLEIYMLRTLPNRNVTEPLTTLRNCYWTAHTITDSTHTGEKCFTIDGTKMNLIKIISCMTRLPTFFLTRNLTQRNELPKWINLTLYAKPKNWKSSYVPHSKGVKPIKSNDATVC